MCAPHNSNVTSVSVIFTIYSYTGSIRFLVNIIFRHGGFFDGKPPRKKRDGCTAGAPRPCDGIITPFWTNFIFITINLVRSRAPFDPARPNYDILSYARAHIALDLSPSLSHLRSLVWRCLALARPDHGSGKCACKRAREPSVMAMFHIRQNSIYPYLQTIDHNCRSVRFFSPLLIIKIHKSLADNMFVHTLPYKNS